ncbi:hypothetical protein AWB80_07558 [Caballeronia pedi]|uniref:Uncharacterized protein n=1 Tax=Caballeronia pedi TaxID=1777141 RepID=A0A158DY10_9BURK|nr:hypothetical protein [Caballeronia pedi]SAK98607.1 hypothetical protein AWB80_07558 [Caballeronia pedi]
MKLTQKLLGLLHRVFDRQPYPFLALRLQYGGGLVWQIADGALTTTVTGGIGQSLSIDLSQYTVRSLVNYLASQPGYSVAYADGTSFSGLSARVLIDASNDISLSNGDHIYGYTNVLWSYVDANANELEQAGQQIDQMLLQMSTTTASDMWIDEIGDYYGVRRQAGELDDSYGPRIVAEVLRPKCNNVAIEMAISAYTGQSTTVTDATEYGAAFPLYDSHITRNSAYTYNAVSRPLYGRFDVVFGYDLLGGADPTSFKTTVQGIVNRIRAAGTQMRSLTLQSGAMSDTFSAPTDLPLNLSLTPILSDTLTAPTEASFGVNVAIASMSDTLTAPTDSESLTIAYNYQYSGLRSYNGTIQRMGIQSVTESL